MKKIITLLAVSLMCSLSAFSQDDYGKGFNYGVRAGVNVADFTSSNGSSRTGLKAGAFVDYNFKRFGLELGAYYSQIGSDDIVTQGVVGNKLDNHLDYIDVAFLAKWRIFNRFRIFVGPQGGCLVNANIIYSDGTKQDVSDSTHPLILSAVGGVGYTFSFGLDLSASYSHGLTPIFDATTKNYNTTFNVSAGWRF
ncbi:MAG: porin family protein [Rikenellaceae bacterium]